MLGLKNHEFSISEYNVDSLYRLICKLEDNNILFNLNEETESVSLAIRDFLNNWDLLESVFTSGTINELYRTGDRKEIKIPIIDKDGFMHIQDDFYINPFTGDWKDLRRESGDIVELILHYGEGYRNNYIYRYDTLRNLLTWGTIDKNIIDSILKSPKKYRKFFIELFYMICKLKFKGDDYLAEYQNFIQVNTFPRSVPWIDHEVKSSGVWIGNIRYYKNLDCPSFPGLEMTFEDIESDYANLFRSISKTAGGIIANLEDLFKYEIYDTVYHLKFLDPTRAESFKHLGRKDRYWWIGYGEVDYEIYQNLDKKEQELIKKGWKGVIKMGFLPPPKTITGDLDLINEWYSNKVIEWD